MPWVATDELHLSTRTIPPGYRLPGWAQTAHMIRVLKSLHGSSCVTWRDDGPTCPVPKADAAPAPPPVVPMSEAEQKDAAWQEWIEAKKHLKPSQGGVAPVEAT